jgi:hypothetical protein
LGLDFTSGSAAAQTSGEREEEEDEVRQTKQIGPPRKQIGPGQLQHHRSQGRRGKKPAASKESPRSTERRCAVARPRRKNGDGDR